jgi:hypothetical protein
MRTAPVEMTNEHLAKQMMKYGDCSKCLECKNLHDPGINNNPNDSPPCFLGKIYLNPNDCPEFKKYEEVQNDSYYKY